MALSKRRLIPQYGLLAYRASTVTTTSFIDVHGCEEGNARELCVFSLEGAPGPCSTVVGGLRAEAGRIRVFERKKSSDVTIEVG